MALKNNDVVSVVVRKRKNAKTTIEWYVNQSRQDFIVEIGGKMVKQQYYPIVESIDGGQYRFNRYHEKLEFKE